MTNRFCRLRKVNLVTDSTSVRTIVMMRLRVAAVVLFVVFMIVLE
ncbi:hypothetical protein [Sphingobacterium pedocola]|nr:hypothetical protein [Sphingobacterium pedocola]